MEKKWLLKKGWLYRKTSRENRTIYLSSALNGRIQAPHHLSEQIDVIRYTFINKEKYIAISLISAEAVHSSPCLWFLTNKKVCSSKIYFRRNKFRKFLSLFLVPLVSLHDYVFTQRLMVCALPMQRYSLLSSINLFKEFIISKLTTSLTIICHRLKPISRVRFYFAE